MDNNCLSVIFSDKAYNAIIRETFEWDPLETGGILLGHVLDNGYWIVMEVLPPGYAEQGDGNNVFHEMGYFEYNHTFVNYLAQSVATQYETPLELLGLWHRHPGSMDHFSGTDDKTNSEFAALCPHGTISGIVNVDPQFRMTMYHLPHSSEQHNACPQYKTVDIEVGTDLIPDEFFLLKYIHGEVADLHPCLPAHKDNNETTLRNVHNADTNAELRNVIKKKDFIIIVLSTILFLLSLLLMKDNIISAMKYIEQQGKELVNPKSNPPKSSTENRSVQEGKDTNGGAAHAIGNKTQKRE